MGKLKTQKISSFFKRKVDDTLDGAVEGSKRAKASTSEPEKQENQPDENASKTSRPNTDELDLNCLERDPAKRKHMWDYSVNERENVRRAYLNMGPFQVELKDYPFKGSKKYPHRFQYSWFKVFPNWLEYSPTSNVAYCFICYLSSDKPNVRYATDAFTVTGFDNWKKVNDGKKCAFLKHLGCSHHRNAVIFSENLLNEATHIDNIIEKQSEEKVLTNRIRLKASIDIVINIVRWLTFQACAFRGHDETPTSKNRGNFLELLKLLTSYNDELSKIIMESRYNSKYTSDSIQKEILLIIANRVRRHIRSEVGDSYFCVTVDESRDESKKEQMAIVLRFVDKNGIIKERFLDLVHVSDTRSLTLKTSLWNTLLHYEFDTSKIRGQGYDGASNIRGEWNGLQALVAKDFPFASYIHCFDHRLQLALVGASNEVIQVYQFFSNLTLIVNVVCASSKRHDELQKTKSTEIKRLVELGEIETDRGKNQVGTLKRAGDTRWGSHYYSICNLLKMFSSTCIVLESIIKDGSYPSQRADRLTHI